MAEAKDMMIPSEGGAEIHVRIWEPEAGPKASVQIVHGIAEHIDRYDSFMQELAREGFLAFGSDHMGHGKTAKDSTELGFFSEHDGWRKATDDLEAVRRGVLKGRRKVPHIIFGHSMGSFLTRSHLIRYPGTADLAVLSGTGHQPLYMTLAGLAAAELVVKAKGAKYRSALLNDMAFGSYNNRMIVPRTAFDWLSRDEEQVNKYIADPLCGFMPSAGLFRDLLTGVKFVTDFNNIAKMDKYIPVMFIAGSSDPVGEYGQGVRRAYNAFRGAGMRHLRLRIYAGARHELLNELNKKDVIEDVIDFIDRYI